jgi:hypothetical protein
MTAANGTCPFSFEDDFEGKELLPPTRNCEFSITLQDEPDFFVTSHHGSDCKRNLKMNIHSICNTPATLASSVFASTTAQKRRELGKVPQQSSQTPITTTAGGQMEESSEVPETTDQYSAAAGLKTAGVGQLLIGVAAAAFALIAHMVC